MSNDGYEVWPDMITPTNMERLLMMFPLSKLLHIANLTTGSPDRAAAWADLGVTDPMEQVKLEQDLDAFINKLAKDHSHA
jgi:hypothetical protein